jgi:hypothetical protein
MNPNVLRERVRNAILARLDHAAWAHCQMKEAAERDIGVILASPLRMGLFGAAARLRLGECGKTFAENPLPAAGSKLKSPRQATRLPFWTCNHSIRTHVITFDSMRRFCALLCLSAIGVADDNRSLPDRTRQYLVDLVKIDTSNPPGNETQAAVFLQQILEKEISESRRDALQKLMMGVAKLDVPLVVDAGVGLNWEKAH